MLSQMCPIFNPIGSDAHVESTIEGQSLHRERQILDKIQEITQTRCSQLQMLQLSARLCGYRVPLDWNNSFLEGKET